MRFHEGVQKKQMRKAASTSGPGWGVDGKELRTQGDSAQPTFCSYPQAAVQASFRSVWLPQTGYITHSARMLSYFSHVRLFTTLHHIDCGLPVSFVHGILHGVGCCALLQGIFPTQGSNPHLLCLLPLAGRVLYHQRCLGSPHVIHRLSAKQTRKASCSTVTKHFKIVAAERDISQCGACLSVRSRGWCCNCVVLWRRQAWVACWRRRNLAEGAGWLGSVEAAVKGVDWPGPLCCAETGCWSGDCDGFLKFIFGCTRFSLLHTGFLFLEVRRLLLIVEASPDEEHRL